METMDRSTRRKLFWLCALLFLLISPPVLFYATGWRITPGFTIERVGGLFIAVPQSGSKVYLNNELKAQTNFFQSGVFIQDLTPHHYSVLVAKDGYWPWTKTLPVKGSEVVEAKALMIPLTVNGELIGTKSPDYKAALAATNAQKREIRTATSSRQMLGLTQDNRGRAQIWFDTNQRVSIQWLSDAPLPFYLDKSKKVIFESHSPIRDISFLPGRDDVVVLASDIGVFALEIDGRGTQNFQPIYKGKEPNFVRVDNTLYVLDSGALAKLTL